MPPAPKIRETASKVRPVEVDAEIETHRLPETDGDQRIPREITVYLQGEAQHPYHVRQGPVAVGCLEAQVHDRRSGVRQTELQEKSPQH